MRKEMLEGSLKLKMGDDTASGLSPFHDMVTIRELSETLFDSVWRRLQMDSFDPSSLWE